jgi:hypothetical protein
MRMRRRTLLTAAALGTAGAGFAGIQILAGPAANAAETTVQPAYGAGLFDVDPDQGSVSQDPSVAVSGDIAAFTEDWGF